MKSHGSEQDEKHSLHSPPKRVYKVEEVIEHQQLRQSKSEGTSLKTICSLLKEYNVEGPEYGRIFYGYAKRNSQPVAIKYSEEGLGGVAELYTRLWRNIAKAEWPCVNRLYDCKCDDRILVLERNKSNIVGLPYDNVLLDLLRILEFIHDCGYLYRNV